MGGTRKDIERILSLSTTQEDGELHVYAEPVHMLAEVLALCRDDSVVVHLALSGLAVAPRQRCRVLIACLRMATLTPDKVAIARRLLSSGSLLGVVVGETSAPPVVEGLPVWPLGEVRRVVSEAVPGIRSSPVAPFIGFLAEVGGGSPGQKGWSPRLRTTPAVHPPRSRGSLGGSACRDPCFGTSGIRLREER